MAEEATGVQVVVYTLAGLQESGTITEGPLLAAMQVRGDNALVVCVVAPDQTVLAYWPIWQAVHLDGLWVSPDHRQQVGVLRPLLEGVSATLRANQIATVFAVLDADSPEGMATAFGFTRMPGALYVRKD